MKIKNIEVYQLDLPYSGGTYKLSGGREYTCFDATLVRMTTDQGIEGWGESTPFGANYIAAHGPGTRAGITEIAPHLIGHDPRHVDRINELMDIALVGHHHAKAAIDVACWDIFGQFAQMPVCDLLGGRVQHTLPLISSTYSGTPEDMHSRVMQHRQNGYLGHSIKIGALDEEGGPRLDAQRIIACLADRQDGEYFIVDANGGLTVETALRMLSLLPADLDFVLEAPCASLRETISLRKRTSVPIVLDELATSESSIIEMIASDAADGVGLKISKCGGLTRARRQRDICIAAGLTMSVQDTVGSDIAFATVLHMGQTVPKHYLRCILDVRDMVSITTAVSDASIINGRIRASDAPGLGISVLKDKLGDPIMQW